MTAIPRRMKPIYIIIFALFGLLGHSQAQILEPVKWSFSTETVGEDSYNLNFKASIDKGWHLYSHFIEEGGPVPTTFYFDESDAFQLNGKIVEDGPREAKYDKIFKMDLAWFHDNATFTQPIKLNEGFTSAKITGELEFMVCDDEKCLPPEYIEFTFNIGPEGEVGIAEEPGGAIDMGGQEMVGVDEGQDDVMTAFEDPVKWSYRVRGVDANTVNVDWKAALDEGWHLYSPSIEEGGPIPTTFYLDGNDHVTAVGELLESGNMTTKQDELFGMELSWFDGEAVFTQKFTVDDLSKPLGGSVEFMVCDDEKCLPPTEIPFEIDLSKQDSWTAFGLAEVEFIDEGCEGLPNIMCEGEFDTSLAESDCTGHNSDDESKSYWIIFLLGFGGGLIALLTPCVFPMIPLTVSFFTKGSEETTGKGIRNAIIYGVSIIVIYVTLGLLVTLVMGPESLNWIATSPAFNVVFFLIFVFFAFSFFGFYELTLPQSWTNKSDQIAAKGGLIGIFFMAFTLALVSFSCTGPIIGTLIVEAVLRGVMGPFFGMLGFAVALALPFTLFAIFPKWLNSLPQSGGWLNSVKVFLGFLELAFALKFLSVADLTQHWGFLKYELFIGLWVLIFGLLGSYMVGIFKFPHDSPGKPGLIKFGVGVLALVFAGYLGYGMANHKPLLSGIAPAPGYSWFNHSECPIGVNICFHDYEEGMAYAKETNKPVMLDFTGYGCVNCRLMENNVWTDDEVNNLLNEYVIISLYVDDRSDLPEEMRYTSTATGKVKDIKKVGKYWHDFQFRHFGTLSQPYYVLVSPDKEVLNEPIAFSSKQDYIQFLQCGLNNLNDVCPECRVGMQ